jgi:aryl-alcohol dehydrogenase-like predicted oxidoreductase
MKPKRNRNISRRDFIESSATAAAGLVITPSLLRLNKKPDLMKRSFGILPHEVTTFGLGGQGSLQWTPDDVDPVAIILKAFDEKVNYFDTSNLYGPSQLNYGRAFRKLGLVPGTAGYNESLRKSIFLTSKTHIRFAKGNLQMEGINNWTNGAEGSHTIDDLKRSLSQIFGDGQGNYPEHAYLDMVLIHDVNCTADLDAVYEGLYNTDNHAERIGALAALRDYRDGTNLTGLNPREEKLIRHIGFSGHYDAGVMMEMIRRDRDNLLQGMLVAINANDKLNFNMQHNVIPVATAKNMGIIGMKTFADGTMYSKGAHWSHEPSHVVRQVGNAGLPSKPLIQYSLTTPGISTLIVGIGQVSDNPEQCQLIRNIEAAQILPDGLTQEERDKIEAMAARVKDGKTNYFQVEKGGLTAPQNIRIEKAGEQKIRVTWDTAYAGNSPLEAYEIWKNGVRAGMVKHIPQTSLKPFEFEDTLASEGKAGYIIATVDKQGNRAESNPLKA